jgi:hypothetical protein
MTGLTISAIACFGAMIFGWDIGAIGGILGLPAFKKYASPNELRERRI